LDIVLFSTADFSFIRTRKQQVAINLSKKGHRVLFIEPPRSGKWKNLPLTRHNLLKKISDNLFVYSPPVFPLMGKYSLINSLNYDFILFNILKIVNKLDFRDITYWLYTLRGFKWIGKLSEKRVVFDSIENWQYSNEEDSLKKKLPSFIKKSDIVFAPSTEIVDYCKKYNHKSFLIPHGVDPSYFKEYKEPDELKKIKRPIIGISASITAQKFDINLVKEIAKKRPDWSIVIIGPILSGENLDCFKDILNIHYLGEKDFDILPAYVKQFDIGFIPFIVNKFTRCTRPLKMFDYIASGIPVVSTRLLEYEDYKDFVKTADKTDDFIRIIEKEITEDSPEKIRKRIETAKGFLWSKRVDSMLDIIMNGGKSV